MGLRASSGRVAWLANGAKEVFFNYPVLMSDQSTTTFTRRANSKGKPMMKTYKLIAIAAAAIAVAGHSQAEIADRPGSPAMARVAAANSSSADKFAADFVCTGTNDEAVLTRAIETLTRGGTLKLADGDYYIDAFPYEGNTAVLFGYNEGRARDRKSVV